MAKLYQKSIWPFIQEYIDKGVTASPLVVDLDLTTFCNLACPECISSPVLNHTFFSSEEIFSLVDQIIEFGVKGVILIGGGEPLMHKDVSKVIRKFGEAGIQIGLVTNGTLIHKHIDAIAEYTSWTRLSIDAGTSATYQSFRPSKSGVSLFEQVICNARLLGAKKRYDMGYSFLLMVRENGETNLMEIEKAGRLAKEIGCDYFELKTMFDPDHNIIHHDLWILEAVKLQIDALREIQDDDFKIYQAFSYKEMLKAGNGQSKKYITCPVAELRTTVTPHGIYPCAYHRNNQDMKIGDIRSTSLSEIWVNKAKKINPVVDCHFECARHDTNIELIKLKAGSKCQIDLVDDWDIFI